MKKVLVIDDDLDVLHLLKSLLDRHGFFVDFISTATGIEKKIIQFEPGLIMLDVNLHDADGRDVCRKLKQDMLTKHIPVILFSSDHTILKEYKDCNADNFMAKPLDTKKLIQELNDYFNNKIELIN